MLKFITIKDIVVAKIDALEGLGVSGTT